jgi:hypothetical protein
LTEILGDILNLIYALQTPGGIPIPELYDILRRPSMIGKMICPRGYVLVVVNSRGRLLVLSIYSYHF